MDSMHGVEARNFLFILNRTHICNDLVLHIAAKLHRFKELHLFDLNRIHIVAGLRNDLGGAYLTYEKIHEKILHFEGAQIFHTT
jgi:hypothetical protein